VGSKRQIFSAIKCVATVPGHPRSIILVPINRKRICDVLLVRHCKFCNYGLWSYLAPFLRHCDLLTKNCPFFLPLSHSAPPLPMFPLEFCGVVNHEETKSHGAILQAPVKTALSRLESFWHDTRLWQTDGRIDRICQSEYSALYSKLCWRAVKTHWNNYNTI